MTEAYILAALPTAAVIAVVLALIVALPRRAAARESRALLDAYGRIPRRDGTAFDRLRAYHQAFADAHPSARRIDATTWNDLNMDDVFKRINACSCSIGEDCLFNLLHELEDAPDELLRRERLIAWLDDHPDDRIRMQKGLRRIGRRADNGFEGFLFRTEARRLGRAWAFQVLAALPLLGVALTVLFSGAGAMVLIGTVCVNIVVYAVNRLAIAERIESLRFFSALLYGAKRIEKGYGKALAELGLDLSGPLAPFRRQGGFVPSGIQNAMLELEALVVLFKAVFLIDFVLYNHTLRAMVRHARELAALYEAVGQLDAMISVASFRRSLKEHCAPEFIKANAIEFERAYHPLIKNPVTNSGVIEKGCLVTGSNASGKSTFIKMLAVNNILAQTIHTCCAARYALSFCYVASSMALRDDILSGESYFIAEIRSIKRIVEYCKRQRCTCFIDEILRGTNTPERIAASTAVLRQLRKTDSLCIVASHDVELSAILEGTYANHHFSEQFEGGKLSFDYRLRDGPSTSTNAIKLLKHMGFDREIVDEALRLVQARQLLCPHGVDSPGGQE